MFPTAATTDCCLAVAAAVISHCPGDKCSARASSRVTQPGFGSASHPSSVGRTEFTHPETAGSGGDGSGGGGVGGGLYVNGIVTGAVASSSSSILLFFFFPPISLKIKRALAAEQVDGRSGSKGFVCIHRYFQILPGIPHGNRGQSLPTDMHAFLNAGEQHPPVSLVLLLLPSARSSHALLFALLLSARTVKSRRTGALVLL